MKKQGVPAKRPRSPPPAKKVLRISDIRNDPIVRPPIENGYVSSGSEGPPGEGINRISWKKFLRFVDEPKVGVQSRTKKRKRQSMTWDRGFRQLKKLKLEHGTLEVPQGQDKDPALEAWLKKVRGQFDKKSLGKPTSLSDRRYRALQSLGFKATGTEKPKSVFEMRLNQLRTFKSEFNHIKVPAGYKKMKGLRVWVLKTQRQMRAKLKGEPSDLSDEQMETLMELGLLERKKRRGKDKKKDNGERNNNNGVMLPETSQGAPPTANFAQRLADLKAYQASFASTHIPTHYKAAPGLREWTISIRKQFWEKAGGCPTELTDGQIYELNEIEFDWDDNDDAKPEQNVNQSVEEHVHDTNGRKRSKLPKSKDPTTFPEHGMQQGGGQTMDNNNNSHGSRRVETETRGEASNTGLNGKKPEDERTYKDDNHHKKKKSMKKVPTPALKLHINSWMTRMKQLTEYKATHGHVMVPEIYPVDQHFADWVHQQKQDFIRRWSGDETALTDDRFQALQRVGFVGQVAKPKPAPSSFDERVAQLKEFYTLHGHAKVPKKYTAAKGLRKWLHKMRSKFSILEQGGDAEISFAEIEVLNSLTFDWRGKRTNSTVARRHDAHRNNGLAALKEPPKEDTNTAPSSTLPFNNAEKAAKPKVHKHEHA